MNIVAIIPARGGSKGIPGKNIELLAGKPLIAWTILAAKKVPAISRVIVNTDDEAIATVAKEWGTEVFMRPKELAEDLTHDLAVFEHHAAELQKTGELPDMIVDLRATAPLRRAERIAEGIDILVKLGHEGADSVRAVSKATKHPFKMWKFENGFIMPFLGKEITGMDEPYNAPRQILPDAFQNNGSMNAFWSDTILKKHSMTGEKIAGYEMEDWESVNIDTPIDWIIAEHLMEEKKNLFEH